MSFVAARDLRHALSACTLALALGASQAAFAADAAVVAPTTLATAPAVAAPAALGTDPAAATPEEWTRIANLRAASKLASSEYGVVDKGRGLYRIPIEHAMSLLAQDPNLLAPIAIKLPDADATPEQKGDALFNLVAACNACHSTDGTPRVGPSMKGVYGRHEEMADGSSLDVDDAYIIESIRTPLVKVVKNFPPAMIPFGPERLTDDDIAHLIAYLKTLK